MTLVLSDLTRTSCLAGLDIDDALEAIDDSYPRATFPSVQPSSAPLLYSVGVNLPPNSGSDWIRAACRLSPGLKELTTSQFSLDSFPVASLTKLQLVDPEPMATVFQVLELVPGLQNISFDVEGPAVTSSAGNILVLKSISRMQLTSAEHLGEFLERTEFPALDDIFIHQIFNWPEAAFRSFLSRSSCALTSLDLYDVHISEDQIIACLQHKACNTLETFAVGGCEPPTADAFLQHLTCREYPFPNPCLKSIELGDIHAGDGLLSALVESRLFRNGFAIPLGGTPPTTLTKVQFSFVEGLFISQMNTHREDWKHLGEMKSELEIEWPEY